MLNVFGALNSGLLKPSEVDIDNNVCKLHHRATVVLLLACCILVTCGQYFGDPIECMTSSAIPGKLLDEYCWISSTYTLPGALDKRVGVDVPHPGIDTHEPGEQRTYHAYYQWVCFMLFLQAIMFYLPHYFWKMCEGGRLRALVSGLKSPLVPPSVVEEKRKLFVAYFMTNFHNHNLYFTRFLFCEILNFVHVIGQIYFTDKFLGGEFSTYGASVVEFMMADQENRTDPMIEVFPRVTKCMFRTYGTSGDIQLHDALCILPLNVVNEKIYVFLWFWLIIVAAISGLALVYRLVLLIFPATRFLLLRMNARMVDSSKIEAIALKSQVGDWWILLQMSKNIDCSIFVQFLSELGSRIEGGIVKRPATNGGKPRANYMGDLELKHAQFQADQCV